MMRFLVAVDVLGIEDEFRQMMKHTTIESFMNLEANFEKKKKFVSTLLWSNFKSDQRSYLTKIDEEIAKNNNSVYNVLCDNYYADIMQR